MKNFFKKTIDTLKWTLPLNQKDTLLNQKQSKIDTLKFEIAQLKRLLFGTKRERFILENNPQQLALLVEVDTLIPKGTDFNQITDKQIKKIQHKINRRPRKKLKYENPKNQFYKLVA